MKKNIMKKMITSKHNQVQSIELTLKILIINVKKHTYIYKDRPTGHILYFIIRNVVHGTKNCNKICYHSLLLDLRYKSAK